MPKLTIDDASYESENDEPVNPRDYVMSEAEEEGKPKGKQRGIIVNCNLNTHN